MEMVTVSKGTSSRIPLAAPYTSVIVVRGRGLLQGIQVLSTWDTALVEQVEGVSEWEISIFLLGYTVSIMALLVAIFIFLYFRFYLQYCNNTIYLFICREMRCLRQKIHLNLFLSVLTANLDWLLIYAVQHLLITWHPDITSILSTINCILNVLLRYFVLTNFFWMFVEGTS